MEMDQTIPLSVSDSVQIEIDRVVFQGYVIEVLSPDRAVILVPIGKETFYKACERRDIILITKGKGEK
jgi:hypothetical protein